ncbi:MAG: folate family ECF transporter S component [Clostridiales bacterium]|nr:folate family ECF transporter S component [Clostridiales bacterium]
MIKESKRINTFSIAVGGLLTAMSIILTRFFGIYVLGNSVRLSFGNIPILLSGALLGPIVGGLTGAIADVGGMLITGGASGPYFPGFTLSSFLVGFIPGLVFYRTKSDYKLWKIAVSVAIVTLLISFGLNTLWLSILLKKGFWLLLPARVISSLIMAPIEVVILYLLLSRIRFRV